MVIREIARLAFALGIEKSIAMGAVPGVLVPAEFPIAGRAHVLRQVRLKGGAYLGVVLAVRVGALCDLHDLLVRVLRFVARRRVLLQLVLGLVLGVVHEVLFCLDGRGQGNL